MTERSAQPLAAVGRSHLAALRTAGSASEVSPITTSVAAIGRVKKIAKEPCDI